MINRRTFLTGVAASPFLGAGKAARKYRACVIGDTQRGGYGHNLHLMWELRDDIEVVALADPDAEGCRARAAEARAKRTYVDYRQMLTKEKPDLVSVGPRWTVHHKDYLLACAEAGSHGLMEKPLAVDLAEADTMIEVVERKKLKWSIAFNFRASPVIHHARRLVMEEGLIGDILEIRSRGKEDQRAGGEDLIVLGVHIFDMMVFFLGQPRWCSASITEGGRSAEPGDVREASEPLGPVIGNRIQVQYGFPGGINGYFSTMKNADGNGGRWGMEIYGSKGIVTIRMETIPDVFWLPEPSWAPGRKNVAWRALPDTPSLLPGASKVWHYAPIIDDLINAIEGDGRPAVSLRDGLMATEMIQAAFESHIQGGAPVRIPLVKRIHPLKTWV